MALEVTDEMVETAAKADYLADTDGYGNWRGEDDNFRKTYRVAVAPLIAAKALRDAADAAARTSDGYGWVGDSVRDWLRARADRIEAKP